MKNEFVSYELSMELKELGFNEPCFGGYFTAHERKSSAPLWQQAFKWFRDKHKLIAVPHYVGGDWKWYDIIVHDDLTGDEIEDAPRVCHTYEIAEEECLKRLMEILKERQRIEAKKLTRKLVRNNLKNTRKSVERN